MADFRRDYGLARADIDSLDIDEWCSLVVGLSLDSRLFVFHRDSAANAQPATVPPVAHLTREEYLQGLSRGRGEVVMVGGEA